MNEIKKSMILMVDDNPKNLQFLGSLLAEEGYEPAAALNGSQALEFLKTKVPDLILLDIMMPEMDGFEVCRILKKNRMTRHIPVIFLTARTAIQDMLKGFKMGGVDYITKPFEPAELLVRVRSQIEMKILRGLIPICAKCKSIRDDKGFWNQVESYLEHHSQAVFSHGLCPKCSKELYGNHTWYKNLKT